MTLANEITMVEGQGTTQPYVFYMAAQPSLCIPAMGLEDGPLGVGDGLTGVTQLPSGASLAATDRRGAIDAWRRAERLRPRDYDLLFNLGMLLAESDAPAEAVPYLHRFVSEAPRPQYAGDIAHVRATLARVDRAAR